VIVDRNGPQLSTYVILRRGGWRTAGEFGAAAERSGVECDRMAGEAAWIRSYVLEESDGSVGSICVFQAPSPEAIRRQAAAADIPVDEILSVVDIRIVRPDPVPGSPEA
jgi:hypothetical protein